jgi:hypothetical protein
VGGWARRPRSNGQEQDTTRQGIIVLLQPRRCPHPAAAVDDDTTEAGLAAGYLVHMAWPGALVDVLW